MRDSNRLVLLSAAAFLARLGWLMRSPEPCGTDGYYYVVQTADLAAGEGLHVPDASWVLQLMGLLGQVLDPVLAVKVGASLLAALCVPAAWFLGDRLERPWTLALLAAASPTLTHLAGDFPKNLGIVAPALVLSALLVDRPRGWHWVAVFGAGLLCATAHRLGAVWVGAALLGALLSRLSPRLLLGALGLGGIFGLAALLLPGLLHPADLERLGGHLGPGLPLAWITLRSTHPLQLVELAAPWLLFLLGLWQARQRRELLVLLVPLGLFLLPAFRTDELDLGYRLALMTPLLAWGLVPKLPRLAWAWVLALPWGFDPLEHPDYARFRGLIARLPERPALLIAHQGINFLYDHETGDEAMAWAPEPELHRADIGRIAWGVRPGQWPEGTRVVMLDGDYSYLPEADWEAALPDLPEEVVQDPRNPTVVRPASLTRGR